MIQCVCKKRTLHWNCTVHIGTTCPLLTISYCRKNSRCYLKRFKTYWQTNKQTNKRTDTHTYKQTHVVGPLGLGPPVGAKGYFRGGIFGRGLSSGSCLQSGGYLLESQTEQQLDGETCTQWTTVVSGPSTSPSYQVPRSLVACPWCSPVPADTPVHAPPESCVALPPCASPASAELASRSLVEPRPSIIHTCSQKTSTSV